MNNKAKAPPQKPQQEQLPKTPDQPPLNNSPAQPQPPDSPGFLNLVHKQGKRKPSATSNTTTRKLGLLNFVSGGRTPMVPAQEQTTSTLPVNLPIVVDNKMAIEADPGPFEVAATERLEALGPVLVILPDDGVIDVVLVELSPLDVYYREKLRLDSHSMTYLSACPTFEEMRQRGYSFQFYSRTKDYVSDSFAILRGLTNELVGEVMDAMMPRSHSYSAHFKLLGHHGEYQARRDQGNEAGGIGKGYRVDLGACDHNYDGENTSGMGPTPRTNGGVKCFREETGIQAIDSNRQALCEYFGCQMDAVQVIVDKTREEHGYKRVFDDFVREESFASKVREEMKATKCRAEVCSNFVTLMDGKDGCSFHKDEKNCSRPSYDWTCCVATTVESEKTGRLYRAVTNLNSREACG